MRRSPHRKWLAGASLAVPPLTIVLTGLAWRSGLPEQVAFHWDAPGRADGWIPAEPLLWATLALACLCLLLGVVTLLVPSRDDADTRKAMTILGTVGAFAAAAWIVPAGATHEAGTPAQADVGGWLVLFLVALCYGLLPRYLTPGDN
ncbi:MAG: hypothetical protein K0S65_4652 [Labilithrix sp.]|nr:hypothetical protein [Labilithrix sp.]